MYGIVAEGAQRPDPHRFQAEGDEHRVFAADVVGDPAEEWPRQPVQHSVDRQRKGQRR